MSSCVYAGCYEEVDSQCYELKRNGKYHVLVVEDDTEAPMQLAIYKTKDDVYVGNDGLEGLEIVKEYYLVTVRHRCQCKDDNNGRKSQGKTHFPVIFQNQKILIEHDSHLGGDDVNKSFV